ncbi:MAG: YkgJ family cysteine cluster protein [Candidatus Heimdallarchaeaceae archaeon]
MLSRAYISYNITKLAEDDLLKILCQKEPEPKEFWYSPLILRRVHENLIEEGKTIGLGKLTPKKVIEKYWQEYQIPIQNDVELRLIMGEKVGLLDELVILCKNTSISKILREDLLSNCPPLKLRNEIVFRVRDAEDIENIVEIIRTILVEKAVSYATTQLYLERKEINKNGQKFVFIVPSNISFSCKRCNMCELPSLYTVNPIPNRSGYDITSYDYRIAYPSNLPTLSLKEAEQISSKTKLPISSFCKPVLSIRKKGTKYVETVFALEQYAGICVFQNLKTRKCLIHKNNPLNCKTYPFLVNRQSEKELVIEVDYVCPGLSFDKNFEPDPLIQLIKHWLETCDSSKLTHITGKEISIFWPLLECFKNGERVRKEEIVYAKNVFCKENSS